MPSPASPVIPPQHSRQCRRQGVCPALPAVPPAGHAGLVLHDTTGDPGCGGLHGRPTSAPSRCSVSHPPRPIQRSPDPGLTRLQPVAAAAHVVPVLLTMVFMLPICTPPLGISRLILCCVDLPAADEGSVRLLRGLLLARERWHQTHHHPDGPSGQQEPVGAPGCRALRGAAGGPEQVGRETPSTGTTHGVRWPLPWAAHPRWPHSPAHGSLPVPDPERPVVTQLANI